MTALLTTWTTRDGGVIPIAEMEDSHLLKTIAMLDRKPVLRVIDWEATLDLAGAASMAMSSCNGEHAIDACCEAMKETIYKVIDFKKSPSYRALVREVKRRAL